MAKFARIDVLNAIYVLGTVPVFYHRNVYVVKEVVNACGEGGARENAWGFEIPDRTSPS